MMTRGSGTDVHIGVHMEMPVVDSIKHRYRWRSSDTSVHCSINELSILMHISFVSRSIRDHEINCEQAEHVNVTNYKFNRKFLLPLLVNCSSIHVVWLVAHITSEYGVSLLVNSTSLGILHVHVYSWFLWMRVLFVVVVVHVTAFGSISHCCVYTAPELSEQWQQQTCTTKSNKNPNVCVA